MDHYRTAARVQDACWDEITDQGLAPVANAMGCALKTMRRKREMQNPDHIGLPLLAYLVRRQIQTMGTSPILMELERCVMDLPDQGSRMHAVQHCVDAIAQGGAVMAVAASAIADARIDRDEAAELRAAIKPMQEGLRQIMDDLEVIR